MGEELQFETVENESLDTPPDNACVACEKEIRDTYFLANGCMVCPECRLEMLDDEPVGSPFGRLSRAVGFGLVGGAIGAGVYYAILKLTGYEVGLVAILVGFLVGGGVRLGSAARGGFGYQALAVVLTYLSIVSGYVPMLVEAMDEQMALDTELMAEEAGVPRIAIMNSGSVLLNGAEVTVDELEAELAVASETQASVWYYREGMDEVDPPPIADTVVDAVEANGFDRMVFKDAEFTEPMLIGESVFASVTADPASFFWGIGSLLLIAAMLPFFEVTQNLIGLAIIGFALYQAWAMNKRERLELEGPLQLTGSMSS